MDPAIRSMIDNLPKNTGRSLPEWFTVLDESGLTRHSELLAHLKQEHQVSHGYANGIALQYRRRDDPEPTDDALVEAQYAGAKAALRPVYEELVARARRLGDDVQVSPKKAGVSLRRSKQFALLTPSSARRLQLGINLGGTPPNERLRAATGMCTHQVAVGAVEDVDDELVSWLRQGYEQS